MKDTSRNNLNDEISLKEIFLFLYNGRLAIFSITGAIAMASIVYVMMITPVYEAKITFKPISHSNLSKINSRKYSELKEYDRTFIAGLVRNIARSNQLIANISTPLPQVDAQSVAPDSYYINKLKFEEIKETREEFEKENPDKEKVTEEFGDILFSMVNLARKMDVDPEKALNVSSRKFIKRFQKVEQKSINQGKNISDMSLGEIDNLWEESK